MAYAHTAEDAEGKRLPECSGKWQLLSDHLRNGQPLIAYPIDGHHTGLPPQRAHTATPTSASWFTT